MSYLTEIHTANVIHTAAKSQKCLLLKMKQLDFKAKAREAPEGGSLVVTFLFWVACTCGI